MGGRDRRRGSEGESAVDAAAVRNRERCRAGWRARARSAGVERPPPPPSPRPRHTFGRGAAIGAASPRRAACVWTASTVGRLPAPTQKVDGGWGEQGRGVGRGGTWGTLLGGVPPLSRRAAPHSGIARGGGRKRGGGGPQRQPPRQFDSSDWSNSPVSPPSRVCARLLLPHAAPANPFSPADAAAHGARANPFSPALGGGAWRASCRDGGETHWGPGGAVAARKVGRLRAPRASPFAFTAFVTVVAAAPPQRSSARRPVGFPV